MTTTNATPSSKATPLNELATPSGLTQPATLQSDTWRTVASDATERIESIVSEYKEYEQQVKADQGLTHSGREERLAKAREKAAGVIDHIHAEKLKYLASFQADGRFDLSSLGAIPSDVPAELMARDLDAIRAHLRSLDPAERPLALKAAVSEGDSNARLVLLAIERDPLSAFGAQLVQPDELSKLKELFIRAAHPEKAQFADDAGEVLRFLDSNRKTARKALGAGPGLPIAS